jgi:hypothetical protein
MYVVKPDVLKPDVLKPDVLWVYRDITPAVPVSITLAGSAAAAAVSRDLPLLTLSVTDLKVRYHPCCPRLRHPGWGCSCCSCQQRLAPSHPLRHRSQG